MIPEPVQFDIIITITAHCRRLEHREARGKKHRQSGRYPAVDRALFEKAGSP
jgi:hypothetical protein